jgi:hypothetical protein
MLGMARGLAASGTAVIAFFVAAVLPTATWPLIDGDVWWHLRAGEEILATAVIARFDSWSIPSQGREWISQDWLTNAVMAAVRGSGTLGETALSFVFGLVVVAAFAILWRTIGVRNPAVKWAARIVWLTVGLILAAPILGVRVQVIDLLMSAMVVWLHAHYMHERRRRWLVALPLVAVAWANIHAGWPILFLLSGALLLGDTIDRLWRRSGMPEPLSWSQLRDLAAAMVIAFMALALNPNGTALWTYPMNAIGNSVIDRYIVEWFPVTDDPRLLGLYVGFVLVAVVPTLALLRRGLRMADTLVVIGLTLMPLIAVRFLLLTGPLIAVIAAATLASDLATSRFGRWAEPKLDSLTVPREGRLLLVHMALAAGLVMLGIGVALARVLPPVQAAAEEAGFPVHAVAWLEAEDLGDRAFNQYEWGGYLIHERPDRLVFVDGRAQDVYPDELLTLYARIVSVQIDPQPELDRFEIDHVVFRPNSTFAAWLDASPDWTRTYADSVAAVWVRNE